MNLPMSNKDARDSTEDKCKSYKSKGANCKGKTGRMKK